MEGLKKGRGAKRTSFTRAYTVIMEAVAVEQPDVVAIRAQYAVLKDKLAELQRFNTAIQEHLQNDATVTEETLAVEMDGCDDYDLRFQTAKQAVLEVIEPRQQPPAPGNVYRPPEFNATMANQTLQETKRYRLPKMEIPHFDGEIRNWLSFWHRFKGIHEAPDITAEDKFQYLIQAVQDGESRAKQVVLSFPPTAENYPKVIESLETRFGRKDLQVEVYVRELLKLVLTHTTEKGNRMSIEKIYDQIETHLRALESLGVTKDMCAAMLYPLVESALPAETIRAWQRHPTSAGVTEAEARLTALMKFLQTEVETEQRIKMASGGFSNSAPTKDTRETKQKKHTSAEKKSTPTAASLHAAESTDKKCIFCSKHDHESPQCEAARKMTRSERTRVAQEKNACFYCLKVGHSYKRCHYQNKCDWCFKKHVLLMCRDRTSGKLVSSTAQQDTEKPIEEPTTMISLNAEPEVFLQTLRVKLVNKEKSTIVRALIDHGSQRSYILGQIAEQLGYESQGSRTMRHLLFGGASSTTTEHHQYQVHVQSLDGSYECDVKAYHQPTICQNFGRVSRGAWVTELRKRAIQLTNKGAEHQPIGLLLGADVVGRLYTGELIQLDCGATAMHTRFGWTLIGENNDSKSHGSDAALATVSMFVREANVSQLWSLDVLGITDPIESKSKLEHQQQVVDRFRDTTTVNSEGRYGVFLPWKENHSPLVNNRIAAERRLEVTLRRLTKDNLLAEYEAVFDEWLQEGVIEKVPDDELHATAHYHPHRPVVKEGGTTRIRPVFDASARDGKSPSMNQCLETGPNLIEYIPALIARFRRRKIGVVADIKKAFLQISIAPQERNNLRFLWRRRGIGPLLEYRFCRVMFGASSSPFQLAATIELHLDQAMNHTTLEEERALLTVLQKSFYVDNCVTSFRSIAEADTFRRLSSKVMMDGGFDLRGWERSFEPGETPVLGLLWNKFQDELRLADSSLNQSIPAKVTKRVILASAHKVFDPIGMASPVLLAPKLRLQQLWQQQSDWDSEVDVEIRDVFLAWCNQLPLLRGVKVRRWNLGDEGDEVSLHVFVDVSKEAYAAVIYARVETPQGVSVEFVEAKSRVAPKERATIPRLELLAATVGARLLHSIREAIEQTEISIHCWSDSTTVLAWIQRNSQWATFVYNRVQEIRQLTRPEWWRHVPGEENPADLPSRGCTAGQLLASQWLRGPKWLHLPSSSWPNPAVEVDESVVQSELRKTSVQRSVSKKPPLTEDTSVSAVNIVNSGTSEVSADPKPWYLRKFSKYDRVVRLVAWIRRFIFNCLRKTQNQKTESGEITPKEWQHAEFTLFRISQSESFQTKADPRLKTLHVFEDKRGLLRLHTPVEYRQDTIHFRNPVILDPRHELVSKLILYWHLKLHHATVGTVVSSLRERVWVLQCRRAVTAVTKKCIVCRRYQGASLQPPPSVLPEDRVRDARVFEVTGIDYAGPFYLNDDSKVWACLFTCAVYRAVHLELVSSLSTKTFLEALRRFVARRGRPSTIYADNATNFHGARNCLKNLHWKKVIHDESVKDIEWRFNPPAAPWWGGFWEGLVRILKDLLKKILGRTSLTFEELATVLCDCEAVMNARPLTYLAEDSQQLTPLTPRSFLQETQEIGVPDLDCVDAHSLNRKLRYLHSLRDQFRQRFRTEYLRALQQRVDKIASVRAIKVNDIVLCGNDTQKRLDWPLARVIDLFPGKDGIIRVAKIKTANGELIRPLQRLIPLEVSPPDQPVIEEKGSTPSSQTPGTSPLSVDVEPPLVSALTPPGTSTTAPNSTMDQPEGRLCSRPAAKECGATTSPVITTRRGRVVKLPGRFQE